MAAYLANDLRVVLAWPMTCLLALGVGLWAGRTTLQPPQVQTDSAAPALYAVVEGTVGRTVPATATADWDRTLLATQSATGTVTSVRAAPDDLIDVGDVVFEVDERPVVVASGDTPMYRDLARGARGRDVAQLQFLLSEIGDFDGEPDGTFGEATHRAVRTFQRSAGVTDDGVVRRGDIVFVDELPARILLDDSIEIGRQVAPGSDAAWALATHPSFTITLTEGQRDLVEPDASVRVEHPDGSWEAVIDSVARVGSDEIVLTLLGRGGGAVCEDECVRLVPPGTPRDFRARIVAVPETTGPLVPAASLRTDAAGRVDVVLESGEHLEVTVVAADAGQAVVDGIEVGTMLRLFGESDEGSSQAANAVPPPRRTDDVVGEGHSQDIDADDGSAALDSPRRSGERW